MSALSDYLMQIENTLGESWLPRIYDRILKTRTRSYQFPTLPKTAAPQIHHTLLGIELKVGRRRMLCGFCAFSWQTRLNSERPGNNHRRSSWLRYGAASFSSATQFLSLRIDREDHQYGPRVGSRQSAPG